MAAYTGDQCEFNLGCDSSPCMNGGTCFITNTGYECTCRPDFSGSNCDVEVFFTWAMIGWLALLFILTLIIMIGLYYGKLRHDRAELAKFQAKHKAKVHKQHEKAVKRNKKKGKHHQADYVKQGKKGNYKWGD